MKSEMYLYGVTTLIVHLGRYVLAFSKALPELFFKVWSSNPLYVCSCVYVRVYIIAHTKIKKFERLLLHLAKLINERTIILNEISVIVMMSHWE